MQGSTVMDQPHPHPSCALGENLKDRAASIAPQREDRRTAYDPGRDV